MRTLILLPLTVVLAFGQDAPKPKDAAVDATYLRDHAQTRGFQLGRPAKAKFTPDGSAVLFLRAQPRAAKQSLFAFDVATGKTTELLTPEKLLAGAEEKLSPEEKARRERQRVSVGGFTAFALSPDGRLILVGLSGQLYTVERAGGKATELATGKGTLVDPKFSPDGTRVSYVLDHDLYTLDLASGKETRVTTGGTEKKSHALAEFVAQEEMARHTGYWWSPDGKAFLYEEADADGVETWYVADPTNPEQAPHASFYPRPGKANVKVRLGIIPSGGGETTWVAWDREKYPYLADVRWDKEGPPTVLVQTRDQQDMRLLDIDPATGKTTELLAVSDPAWVNIVHDTPRWLADGSFLWTNQTKAGYQLERRGRKGELLGVLAAPETGYRELLAFDEAAKTAFFLGTSRPTERHVFSLPLAGGKPVALTRDEGVHAAVFSKDAGRYVVTAATPKAMPRSVVCKADGTALGELPSVAENPPFVPNAEVVQVGDDGYWAMIQRPKDFDASKKYPVIVKVYGGPGHQQVLASMAPRLIDQWIADQGFVVVSVDNKGTPGRSRDWEKAVYLKFGSVPLEGQVAGLKALGKKFPEMDLERVGIYGWSFGGYMAAQAVLREPDVFKVGVAGAPVTEWLDYDTHYTERFLNLPQKEETAYTSGSLLPLAKELRRPLLLVHGTVDDNVFFRHTLRLADALFREGKEFDLLPLPGLTHMVPDPVVTQRMYGKFAEYFRRHLGGPR